MGIARRFLSPILTVVAPSLTDHHHVLLLSSFTPNIINNIITIISNKDSPFPIIHSASSPHLPPTSTTLSSTTSLPYHAIPGGHQQQQQPPPLLIYPQHEQQYHQQQKQQPLPYHATPVGHQPVPYPVVVQQDTHVTESKLPFCGLGLGWTLLLAGFILAFIPWYIGVFILLFVSVDSRVKPGLIACAFAAALVTTPLIEPFFEIFR